MAEPTLIEALHDLIERNANYDPQRPNARRSWEHGIDCESITWDYNGIASDSGNPCDCWRSVVTALLSQPTQTADPPVSICDCGHARSEHWGPDGQCTVTDCRCWGHVHKEFYGQPTAPPSIADMVPGTTFVASAPGWNPQTFRVGDRRHIERAVWRTTGWATYDNDIDPSTIRDVTPPA